MYVSDDQIAGFSTSVLGKFRKSEPWELTINARYIVEQLLETAKQGYAGASDVRVHSTSVIENGAILKGPAIVGPNCFVAAGAYVRDGCWLDTDCILGPGVELKSSFVFSRTKLAHFNFVGDSILGHRVNLEAGSIIANYRNEWDVSIISFVCQGELVNTGVEKFGAVLGDRTRVGANAVIAPGAVLPPDSIVKRLSLVDQGNATSVD